MARGTRLHKRCMARLFEVLTIGGPPYTTVACDACGDFASTSVVNALEWATEQGRTDAPFRGCAFCETPGELLPKYPGIHVRLGSLCGSAENEESIFNKVRFALIAHGVDDEEIECFETEAARGDYAHMVGTMGKWVWVTFKP